VETVAFQQLAHAASGLGTSRATVEVRDLRIDARQFLIVGDFVAVKASSRHKLQQLSTNRLQPIQEQSLKNDKFQQSSTRF
jgi:hypothetical protein